MAFVGIDKRNEMKTTIYDLYIFNENTWIYYIQREADRDMYAGVPRLYAISNVLGCS